MNGPTYWPDGSLKHRWQALVRPQGVHVCIWCSNTRGPVTQGKPCPGTDLVHRETLLEHDDGLGDELHCASSSGGDSGLPPARKFDGADHPIGAGMHG